MNIRKVFEDENGGITIIDCSTNDLWFFREIPDNMRGSLIQDLLDEDTYLWTADEKMILIGLKEILKDYRDEYLIAETTEKGIIKLYPSRMRKAGRDYCGIK
ncbi:MAG TPA: hypothetical protein PLV55_05955 [Anaerohalosphaeraceae bacterium]|nr:hypothetical protein [Anaerohalosphaeraceae bacterium]